jgi:hypothetical protein
LLFFNTNVVTPLLKTATSPLVPADLEFLFPGGKG